MKASSSSPDPLRWYEFPQLYDLGFQDETQPEADFMQQAFARYVDGEVQRILEPGCGTGRLVVELAKRGYHVTGFDLSQPSLDFLQKKLSRKKLQAEILVADMASFDLKSMGCAEPFDAAINTFNTFRHLLTEADSLSHLQCVAKHVRKGGIFILGLHLLPPDAELITSERWRAKQGALSVHYTLRVMEADRRKRIEKLRISMLARRGDSTRKIQAEFDLRMYRADQMKSLLAKTPEWELCDVFDFWYEIDHPLALNDDISDTVLILKRR